MNNEDCVICARERGAMEGAAAGVGLVTVERSAAALKQVAAVLLVLMRTEGRTFGQGYITRAASLEGSVAAIYRRALMEEMP